MIIFVHFYFPFSVHCYIIIYKPLRPHIIESATRVVNYRQYLYKNETMLRFFNDSSSIEIDYELCEKLGLESIFKIKTQEEWNKDYYKKKLKTEGKVTEKEKILQRREKIKDLLAKGLKQKDICSQLDISKPTYVRDRNFLKEQGLI